MDKGIWEGKAEWARRRMARNAEIETLTEEQHNALECLCHIRHETHKGKETFWNAEDGEHGKYWDYISGGDGGSTINEMLTDAGLPAITWSFNPDEYLTDAICYELGYSEEETEEEKENLFEMLETFNKDIENYLTKIDKENGTDYAPSGYTRLL